MWSSATGCKIERTGSPGGYGYAVATAGADRPVNYVSWGDAARFANWLHNGGADGTTETGAYFLNGATTGVELLAVKREPIATSAIPTEDEWYKAAYYDGDSGVYYDYPTGTNTEPSHVLDDPDAGNNANFFMVHGGYTIGSPHYRTEVGQFANSAGPYGTFDQGGNVWEWNEDMYDSPSPWRGLLGGAYDAPDGPLHAAYRHSTAAPDESYASVGFRLAELTPSVLFGDANNNGFVDDADLAVLLANWQDDPNVLSAWSRGDFNGDNNVNDADLSILLANWTGPPPPGASIPEPATLALLTLGALPMLRRKLP